MTNTARLTHGLAAVFTSGQRLLLSTLGALCLEDWSLDGLLFGKCFQELSNRAIYVKRADSIIGNTEELTTLGTPAPASILFSESFQTAATKRVLTRQHAGIGVDFETDGTFDELVDEILAWIGLTESGRW